MFSYMHYIIEVTKKTKKSIKIMKAMLDFRTENNVIDFLLNFYDKNKSKEVKR